MHQSLIHFISSPIISYHIISYHITSVPPVSQSVSHLQQRVVEGAIRVHSERVPAVDRLESPGRHAGGHQQVQTGGIGRGTGLEEAQGACMEGGGRRGVSDIYYDINVLIRGRGRDMRSDEN
jgi:hypothetical protein